MNGVLPTPVLDATPPEPRAARRSPAGDAGHLAWQREMERAEADAWFKRFETGAAHAATPTTLPVAPIKHGIAATGPGEVAIHGGSPIPGAHTAMAQDRGRPSPATESRRAAAPTAGASSRRASDGGDTPSRSLPAAVTAGPPTTRLSSVTPTPVPTNGRGTTTPELSSAAFRPQQVEGQPVPAGGGATASADPHQPALNPTAFAVSPPPTGAVSGTKSVAESRGSTHVTAFVARAFEAMPPIRLHIETTGTTVALWLGLDVAALPKLPAILEQLTRQLARNGFRLRSVVCNGTPRSISHFVKEP